MSYTRYIDIVQAAFFTPFQQGLTDIDGRYSHDLCQEMVGNADILFDAITSDYSADNDAISTYKSTNVRTEFIMFAICQKVGMPEWQAAAMAAELAYNRQHMETYEYFGNVVARLAGMPQGTNPLATGMRETSLPYLFSQWKGPSSEPGSDKIKMAPDIFEDEWSNAPTYFYWNSLSGLPDGMTALGLSFLKIGLSAAVNDPDYKPWPLTTERQLYDQWFLRPAGISPEKWHALTHDVWVNSAAYRQQTDIANKLAIDNQVNESNFTASDTAGDGGGMVDLPQPAVGMSTGTKVAIGVSIAAVVGGLIYYFMRGE